MVPQHPSNTRQQQGLGVPSTPSQAQPNPYYQPSVALEAFNAQLTGQDQLKQAQAYQAGAEAGKARTEAAILDSLAPGMLGSRTMVQDSPAPGMLGGLTMEPAEPAPGMLGGRVLPGPNNNTSYNGLGYVN